MKTFFCFIAFFLFNTPSYSQDISGYWQGVSYHHNDSVSEYWVLSLHIQQTNTAINGVFHYHDPKHKSMFVDFEVKGNINNNLFQIQLGRILKQNNPTSDEWCMDEKGKLKYNPNEEILDGKVVSSNCLYPSTIKLYHLKLKTKSRFCKNEKIVIETTGKGVKWYQDKTKSKLVNNGNLFEPNISKTTTFYVTQTHYSQESPPIPIIIEVIDYPKIVETKIEDASFNSNTGSINVIANGDEPIKYSIDNINYQSSNQFKNVFAGNYTLTISDKNNCINTKTIVLDSKNSNYKTPSTTNMEINNPITKASLENGQTIKFDNIYFEQSTYTLQLISYTELDKIVEMLKETQEIKIEIGGHTDNVGDLRLNLALSENRAKVIFNYLVSKGIDENRLYFKGYGSNKPLVPNTSEENKKKNRRVEFIVFE